MGELKTTPLRSKIMSQIHSKGGKGETLLAKKLWHEGFRYRRNYRKLPGTPDIVMTKYKIAIFVDGEFWHGYDLKKLKQRIHRNHNYWISKIEKNKARDKTKQAELESKGWVVLRFWEKNQVLKDVDSCIRRINEAVRKRTDEHLETKPRLK